MNDLYNFIKGFIESEWLYNIAVHCEKNENNFSILEKNHWSFFSNRIPPLIGRPVPLPQNWFENCEENKKYFQKRKLYKIKEYYDSNEHIQVYACYIGGCYTYLEGGYDQCMFVEKSSSKNSFKIVSRYFLDPPPRKDTFNLIRSGILNWYLDSGKIISNLGKALTVQNYEKPTMELHVEDYLSE